MPATTRPLEGRTVLITRPADSDPVLADTLRRNGATVRWRPALAIDRAFEMPELEAALEAINSFSWIVLTSANAIASVRAVLGRLRIQTCALTDIRVAVVGPSTARAALRLGITVATIAEPHNAAGLLKALQRHVRAGDQVLYPRAARVSNDLADGLRAMGAIVTAPVAYRTLPVAVDKRFASASTHTDCTVFCSPSAVAAVARSGMSLHASVIACIGPSTASAARAAGLEVRITPEHSTGEALGLAIVDYYSTPLS